MEQIDHLVVKYFRFDLSAMAPAIKGWRAVSFRIEDSDFRRVPVELFSVLPLWRSTIGAKLIVEKPEGTELLYTRDWDEYLAVLWSGRTRINRVLMVGPQEDWALYADEDCSSISAAPDIFEQLEQSAASVGINMLQMSLQSWGSGDRCGEFSDSVALAYDGRN